MARIDRFPLAGFPLVTCMYVSHASPYPYTFLLFLSPPSSNPALCTPLPSSLALQAATVAPGASAKAANAPAHVPIPVVVFACAVLATKMKWASARISGQELRKQLEEKNYWPEVPGQRSFSMVSLHGRILDTFAFERVCSWK